MILYLHGFQSGPASEKAQLMQQWAQEQGRDDLLCPQLPVRPAAAMELILELTAACPAEQLCLVGSSLGGYYSLHAAEKLGCRAVLINPAVRPYELLQDYLGWHEHPYTGERFEIRAEHLHELLSLDVANIRRPQHYWLLTQTGDEVLDWRQAVEKLPGAHHSVLDGGDHAFAGFADWIPAIYAFADGLPPQTPVAAMASRAALR